MRSSRTIVTPLSDPSAKSILADYEKRGRGAVVLYLKSAAETEPGCFVDCDVEALVAAEIVVAAHGAPHGHIGRYATLKRHQMEPEASLAKLPGSAISEDHFGQLDGLVPLALKAVSRIKEGPSGWVDHLSVAEFEAGEVGLIEQHGVYLRDLERRLETAQNRPAATKRPLFRIVATWWERLRPLSRRKRSGIGER